MLKVLDIPSQEYLPFIRGILKTGWISRVQRKELFNSLMKSLFSSQSSQSRLLGGGGRLPLYSPSPERSLLSYYINQYTEVLLCHKDRNKNERVILVPKTTWHQDQGGPAWAFYNYILCAQVLLASVLSPEMCWEYNPNCHQVGSLSPSRMTFSTTFPSSTTLKISSNLKRGKGTIWNHQQIPGCHCPSLGLNLIFCNFT